MERLTKRTSGGDYCPTKCTNEHQRIQRLAAYEDILFAPDGAQRITLERLEELVKAEQDGRCVVLPCKVGERWMSDGKQYIVAEISITESCGTMVRHYGDGNGEMLSCNPQYFAKHYTRHAASDWR